MSLGPWWLVPPDAPASPAHVAERMVPAAWLIAGQGRPMCTSSDFARWAAEPSRTVPMECRRCGRCWVATLADSDGGAGCPSCGSWVPA